MLKLVKDQRLLWMCLVLFFFCCFVFQYAEHPVWFKLVFNNSARCTYLCLHVLNLICFSAISQSCTNSLSDSSSQRKQMIVICYKQWCSCLLLTGSWCREIVTWGTSKNLITPFHRLPLYIPGCKHTPQLQHFTPRQLTDSRITYLVEIDNGGTWSALRMLSASRGLASLKFKVQASLHAKKSIYKQRRPRWDAAKRGVSSGSALFARINTFLVMVDYKNCIWSGPHSLCVNWWQTIKGCLWGGIPTSSQIINIGSSHTFCTHNIKNPRNFSFFAQMYT